MPSRIRTQLEVEADVRTREQFGRLGRELRNGRVARHLTQARLGAKVGLSQGAISRAERGLGGGLTLDAWQRIGVALGRPLTVAFQRDTTGETADAGHLGMQELLLRMGRAAGYAGSVELATRPMEPWRSADIGLRDERRRRLLLVECWNTIGDIGGAARSSDRKRAEAEALAVARWGEAPQAVGVVWVVRATPRNRALVARYPEVFAARFPGSSAGWVRALVSGTLPPAEPGLVWCDVQATRLFARRRPARAGVGSWRSRGERGAASGGMARGFAMAARGEAGAGEPGRRRPLTRDCRSMAPARACPRATLRPSRRRPRGVASAGAEASAGRCEPRGRTSAKVAREPCGRRPIARREGSRISRPR